MAGRAAAFMSYARFNDRHYDGQLTQFCAQLSAEVQIQTGEEFAIFQDRDGTAWGQGWQQRIDEELDAVTLLLPILTPGFFRSPACRYDVERFLDRESDLGRADLILPVYYVSTLALDDAEQRKGDDLAAVLASRQFADWRELRFEPMTSPTVRRAVAQLAIQVRDTLRPSPVQRRTSKTVAPTAKTEPSTLVVDAYQRGEFETVGAAIKAARPGDRILVRPGLYQEKLVVDKPVEILGDGSAADIEIRVRGATVLLFRANIGRISNLTLRQAGGEGSWFGVDITQGHLELEGCDISSQSGSGVVIRDGADARLRRNDIHHCDHDGIIIYNLGTGVLEENNIHANVFSGVAIRTGGNPILRRNNIHDCRRGVLVWKRGSATLEDNDIHSNHRAGVEIRDDGHPTLRGNRINRNGYQAVCIYQGGGGVFDSNDLTDNMDQAWKISTGSRRKVTITDNREY